MKYRDEIQVGQVPDLPSAKVNPQPILSPDS
jgi:hypothetical protein